jgi:hypothetical protein
MAFMVSAICEDMVMVGGKLVILAEQMEGLPVVRAFPARDPVPGCINFNLCWRDSI